MYRLASYICILSIGIASVVSAPASNATTLVDHTGKATWFNPGLGNCGKVHNDNSPIVAISKAFYDQNNGGNCDQWMQITDQRNGRTVFAQTEDSCPGCGFFDIDLSPSVFSKLEPLDVGVIPVVWHFLAKGVTP